MSSKFWCKIYKGRPQDYGELAKLSLLILSLSPDNMESERGISVLNLQKTKYRNRLENPALDAVVGVGMGVISKRIMIENHLVTIHLKLKSYKFH